MTLREKQSVFVRLIARLIQHFDGQNSYALTFGEGWRSEWEATRLAKAHLGITRSLHCDRLAHDFNLFINGTWQTDGEAFRAMGEWWEKQSTVEYKCCWGGRFKDGNHFSIEHEGRR